MYIHIYIYIYIYIYIFIYIYSLRGPADRRPLVHGLNTIILEDYNKVIL